MSMGTLMGGATFNVSWPTGELGGMGRFFQSSNSGNSLQPVYVFTLYDLQDLKVP